MEDLIKNLLHLKPDEADEFFTDERCHILEYYNTSKDRSQSIARARVTPGVTTAWHRLTSTSETILVLSGMGVLDLYDETKRIELVKNSVVKIPKDCPQRVTNTGDTDLIFLCFCTPAFSDETYEDLE